MKISSIENRTFKNILVGYLSFFLNLIQTILLVPILISAWGTEIYGIWLSIFAAFTLLQTLDTGHQIFVGNEINILHHSDQNKSRFVLGSAISMAYLLGSIELLLTLLILFTNKLELLIQSQNQIISQIDIGLSLLSLIIMWLIFGSVGGVLIRLLIPIGLLYESQWLGIMMRLSQFISLIIVAYTGGTILVAAIFYSIVQSAISIIIIYYIKKHTQEYYPWWKYRSLRQAFSNLKKSIVITINTIVQQFSNNGIVLFISYFFSPTTVPLFTTIRTLTNSASSISNVVSNSLVPDLARLHAYGEPGKIKNIIYTNWFLTNALVGIGIFIVLPFINHIYRIWTHGQLEFNFTLFLLLAGSVSFTNFGAGIITYITVINNIKAQTYITFLRTLIIFFISYLLIGTFKLAAIGFSILIAEVAASFLVPVYFFHKILKSMDEKIDKEQIFLGIAPSLLILITILLIDKFQFDIFLISMLMIALLLLNTIIYWKFLENQIKLRLKEFFFYKIHLKN